MAKRGRPKKNKKKEGIIPFEPNIDIKIIKENSDGSWIGRIIPIKATLKILGKTFTSQGYSIDEVLNGFQAQGWIKGAGVLSIEKDGKIKEKIIAGNHIRNIFGLASGTMRDVSLKWIKQLFE